MSAGVTLTFRIADEPGVRNMFARASQEESRGCIRGVDMGCKEGAAHALAVRTWKDQTGDTRRSTKGYIVRQDPDGAEGVIVVGTKYSSFLDSGTKPHRIEIKNAKALRWFDAGGTPRFAKSVMHPGTKGDGFFGAGVKKAERVVLREIELGNERAQGVLDEP